MPSVLYALLAVIPSVVVTLLLRFLIQELGWPVGLVGTFCRLVTVPLLIVWVLATGSGLARLRPRGKGWWLLLMGILSIGIHLLWFGSLKWTTATNVAMLFRFDLLFVVLIGAMLGLERIGAAQVALVPVMLVGLALVTEIDKFDWGGHLVGDVMIVAAALGFAINAFIIRHIMKVMDEESVALYNHSMNMLGFLALGLVGGDFARSAEALRTPAVWQSLAALGAISAVGLPLYYMALGRMDVWKLRTFMLSGPLITAMVEWPLFGIKLSGLQFSGAAIILVGLVVLIRVESRPDSKAGSQDNAEPALAASESHPAEATSAECGAPKGRNLTP